MVMLWWKRRLKMCEIPWTELDRRGFDVFKPELGYTEERFLAFIDDRTQAIIDLEVRVQRLKADLFGVKIRRQENETKD